MSRWFVLPLSPRPLSRSMLYNGSEVIRDLEWVIFDEVHYINDTEVRAYVHVQTVMGLNQTRVPQAGLACDPLFVFINIY